MDDLTAYTTEEVACCLKVTQRTVYSYIKAKQLKATKIGKYWRVKHSDLQLFIDNGTSQL